MSNLVDQFAIRVMLEQAGYIQYIEPTQDEESAVMDAMSDDQYEDFMTDGPDLATWCVAHVRGFEVAEAAIARARRG